jgi:hypothetical protein
MTDKEYYDHQEVAELVEPTNVIQMLDDALDAADIKYNRYDVIKGEVYLGGTGKTICEGRAEIDGVSVTFEIVAGTSNREVYVFDELEVIIKPEEEA